MPKTLRACGFPGCHEIVTAGNCSSHQTVRAKDPEQERFYSSGRWKRIRSMVKVQEPTCRMCKEATTEVIDHIDGDWQNNARGNLRGLCRACNASHTGRQHQGKR